MRYKLPSADDRRIWDIWLSMYHLPSLAVADELRLFEELEKSPASAVQLAQRCQLVPEGTDVLLCMLSALGLASAKRGVYRLTPVAKAYLLPSSPFYWGPLIKRLGILPEQHNALKRRLTDPAAPSAGKDKAVDSWEAGQLSLERAVAITGVMHAHSLPAALGAARSGCFDKVQRLLDVGGGSGCFSIAVAQRRPKARCTIMDLPAVCQAAQRYIAEGAVADRVDSTAVDMFRAAWPPGYDGVLFSNIFHDWSRETNLQLAQSAFGALPSGGRIFLHEMLQDPKTGGPLTTAAFSIGMLVGTRGRQYTFGDLKQILTQAGFVGARATRTYGYYSVVSARKP